MVARHLNHTCRYINRETSYSRATSHQSPGTRVKCLPDKTPLPPAVPCDRFVTKASHIPTLPPCAIAWVLPIIAGGFPVGSAVDSLRSLQSKPLISSPPLCLGTLSKRPTILMCGRGGAPLLLSSYHINIYASRRKPRAQTRCGAPLRRPPYSTSLWRCRVYAVTHLSDVQRPSGHL